MLSFFNSIWELLFYGAPILFIAAITFVIFGAVKHNKKILAYGGIVLAVSVVACVIFIALFLYNLTHA